MKRFVDIPTYELHVEVNYLPSDDVSASSKSVDGNIHFIDNQFQSFVYNVIGAIDQYDFEIVDKYPSDRPESNSYYVTFYATDNEGKIQAKLIIFFRLSDHNLPNIEQRSVGYHKKEAEKHKKSDRKVQMYKFHNIVVDDKSFQGYTSALEHIYSLLDDMKDGHTSSKYIRMWRNW